MPIPPKYKEAVGFLWVIFYKVSFYFFVLKEGQCLFVCLSFYTIIMSALTLLQFMDLQIWQNAAAPWMYNTHLIGLGSKARSYFDVREPTYGTYVTYRNRSGASFVSCKIKDV